MEFEKRWITYTIAGVWLLRKLLLFYFAIEYRIDPIDEYANYMFDAFVLTCAFASLEKHTATRIGKSLLAAITSVVFVGVIIIQNYFLDYLRFLPHSYGYGMGNMTINALKRYLRYGYPGYHWAFLGMLAICFIVIIFRACKPKIMYAIADFLFERAMKTKKSIYFTLVFDHFIRYITAAEYLILKDAYLHSELKYSIISRCFEDEDFAEMDGLLQPILDLLQNQEKTDADVTEKESAETEEAPTEQIDDNCVSSKETNEEQ